MFFHSTNPTWNKCLSNHLLVCVCLCFLCVNVSWCECVCRSLIIIYFVNINFALRLLSKFNKDRKPVCFVLLLVFFSLLQFFLYFAWFSLWLILKCYDASFALVWEGDNILKFIIIVAVLLSFNNIHVGIFCNMMFAENAQCTLQYSLVHILNLFV